jgi:hypothetical protein
MTVFIFWNLCYFLSHARAHGNGFGAHSDFWSKPFWTDDPKHAFFLYLMLVLSNPGDWIIRQTFVAQPPWGIQIVSSLQLGWCEMTECIYSELSSCISCHHVAVGSFENKCLLFSPFRFLCPCAILGGTINSMYMLAYWQVSLVTCCVYFNLLHINVMCCHQILCHWVISILCHMYIGIILFVK